MGNCLCLKETVKLNGRTYFVKDFLGEGGFSTVHLVEDPTSHTFYALKRIICHSPGDQKIALNEVEYHSMLRHSNIIPCVASDLIGVPDTIGSKTSEVLLLLPYFPRGTLHDELVRRSRDRNFFLEKEVLRIFSGICAAVHHMHSQNPPLAHRDLKTANVLLKYDNTPVIMDLGSTCVARVEVRGAAEARQLQDTAAERSSMTSRAPELFNVASHCDVDERSDVWSLGCLLFALCFFKTPFDSVYERGDSVALAVVGGKINFPENHPFSKDICELILSMLQVEPERRPFIDFIMETVSKLSEKYSSHGGRSDCGDRTGAVIS